VTSPDPGIYHGMSFADYRAIDAMNASGVKSFLRSPAQFHWELAHPRPQTAAMALGTACHLKVFQPIEFAQQYIAMPKINRSTKVGKAAHAAFEAAAEGKALITMGEHAKCEAVRAAALANPVAKALLESGDPEVVLIWEDPETGVLCKARLDWLALAIVDLKTTKDASPEGFGREIAKYDYHVQSAMYRDGLHVLTGEAKPFKFLAVETAPPYSSCVHTIGTHSLEAGRSAYKRALFAYRTCYIENNWPGYPPETKATEMPKWALARELGQEIYDADF